MDDDPHNLGAPRNRREAKAWVRRHWQTLMRLQDVPCTMDMTDAAADLIADVFCEESSKLADRLNPRCAR